jgi:cytochrome P450
MRFLSTYLSPEDQVQAVQGMEAYFHYMADLVAERRRHPRQNDLVTLLAQHHEPGFEPLEVHELVNNLGGILLAGHVTTTTLIGTAVKVLLELERGRFWDDIVAHPEHIPVVLEEVLRYRTPTKAFFRSATRDTVLNGAKIAEGDLLQILFGSANHDESRWKNPEVFDPWADRRGARLMSFGHGPHYCAGASLARTQAKIALATLSRRLPELRLAEQEYRYLPTVILHGLLQLRVEW